MTWFDAIVIAITLISGLLAMVRGFVHEALSILAWATAAVAAFVALPYLSPIVSEFIGPAWLADAAAALAVFVFVLFMVSVFTFRLAARVPDGRVGLLDHTGGLVFGLVRGFLLVTIAYIFLAWLIVPKDFPPWLEDSRLRPVVSLAAETITDWFNSLGQSTPEAPVDALPGAPNAGNTANDSKSDSKGDGEGSAAAPAAPPDSTADTVQDEGYKTEERRQLEQLIESVEEDGS